MLVCCALNREGWTNTVTVVGKPIDDLLQPFGSLELLLLPAARLQYYSGTSPSCGMEEGRLGHKKDNLINIYENTFMGWGVLHWFAASMSVGDAI
jgi:hypothetical protein